MASIGAVTVFCSSSSAVSRVFHDAAGELGGAIARQKWTLVYGGNFVGLMAAVAQGARDAGGRVVGVTPQLMVDKGLSDSKADELIVTNGMRDRKAILEQRCDAFVTLPGGLGTFEELFEVVVGKQLGYHSKPIVLLNVDDFYRPLLTLLDHGVDQKFIRPAARELIFVADSVSMAMNYLTTYQPRETPNQWFAEHQPPSAVE